MRVVRKGTRSLSPSELRELYGLTMREIYSAERNFLKESYKKDKQDLQYHLDALTTEHTSKLREMEHQRRLFIRDHEKIIRHPTRKKKYQKTFSVTDRPESAVPPCIPFSGMDFPPKRHARSARCLSELRSARLLSRNTTTSSFTGLELDDDDDCDAELARITGDGFASSSAWSKPAESNGDQQLGSGSYNHHRKSVVVQARPKSVTSSRRQSKPEGVSIEDVQTAVMMYAGSGAMEQERGSDRDKAPLLRQDSKETFSRQDTPSRGSDATYTSLDDDRLLQELHEYAQHVLIKSKWVSPEEIAQLRPAKSCDDSLATSRPDSELLGQSRTDSLPPAISPSVGNVSVTPQEERNGRGSQVKEMVDEWLDQLHTTPKAFSKTSIRSEWHQLCERIADLNTNPLDDTTADEENRECKDEHKGEETENIKHGANVKLIKRENSTMAQSNKALSQCSKSIAIEPCCTEQASNSATMSAEKKTRNQTSTVGFTPSAAHLNQSTSPAQCDTEQKDMPLKTSADEQDSKTPFLASLLSSEQLSSTYPPSKPKSGALCLPVVNTEKDRRITSPRAATDNRDNLILLTASDTRRDSSDTISTTASSKTGGQSLTGRFRKRANTTDNYARPAGTIRARARNTSDQSSRTTPSHEPTLLAVHRPHDSIRRHSSDSGYISYSEDRRSTFSPGIAAPGSHTGRDNVHTKRLNSRTTVSTIPLRSAKTPSYAESAHPTGQSSDFASTSRRISRAPENRAKSPSRSPRSPHTVRSPLIRYPEQIEGEITPRCQSHQSVVSSLPSVTGTTNHNLRVPTLILPPCDDVPERLPDGKRVSFSIISQVQSVSSQSLDTDEDSERGFSSPRRPSFVPETGSRLDSDRLIRRQSINAGGSSRTRDRKRTHSSFQTRPHAARMCRKSHSAQPVEYDREAHIEDMTLEEYQEFLRKEMSPPEQEVTLHTDARGRQHKLFVSKVSLHGTSSREANVTIRHEDNVEKSKTEEADNETDDEAHAPTQDYVSVDTEVTENTTEEPTSRPASSRKSSLSINQSRSSSIGAEEDENIALWRRRLSQPHRDSYSWMPEFAQDKDAQALALALLARKRGVGEGADRFKAVAQALAAANHLLEKRHQETMMVVEELRHCRYLRMPAHYMAEEFQELALAEVFS